MNCGGNPCNFFPCTGQLSSMERETIYVEGDQATATAKSPRLINSGGSGAGIETPISIIGGGSGSGHVVDSKVAMRELIPLGRSSAAHLEDFAWPGELQGGRSIVGGQRGGRIMRGRSSGSSMPMAAAGSWDSIPPSAGDGSDRGSTKRMQELRGKASESITSSSVSKKRRIQIAKSKDEQRTSEARDHCRWTMLMWFENHRWEYLESKYLNNCERGIDVAKEDLKLLLLDAMGGDEFAEDIGG